MRAHVGSFACFRLVFVIAQMGGSDQWGNILSGIDLIRRAMPSAGPSATAEASPLGLTFPLLTTASGAKIGQAASLPTRGSHRSLLTVPH